MMEKDGSDVVEMTVERKQATATLVRPNLDLVVVATRNEEWLRLVEVDAADGPIVLFESINQRSHSVVP
jgi:hypothetical protein